jgi:hypothetical protein
MRGLAKAILVAAGLLCSAPTFAADLPTKKPAPVLEPAPVIPSTWHFELTGYAWATSLSGNAGVGRYPSAPFFASFGDILKHFQGAFMGSAIARNDTFIGGVDLIWSRVGTGLTFKNPDSPLYGVGADLKLSSTIVTGFGGLRIPIGPPNLALYGTVGARYFNDRLSVTLRTPVFGFERSATGNRDWVDPVIGLAGTYRIDDRWFVNGLADIGGLSNSATGQALGSVGYNWTRNISTTLGYRVMYAYDKQDNARNGSFRIQQWMYGPFAALKYGF